MGEAKRASWRAHEPTRSLTNAPAGSPSGRPAGSQPASQPARRCTRDAPFLARHATAPAAATFCAHSHCTANQPPDVSPTRLQPTSLRRPTSTKLYCLSSILSTASGRASGGLASRLERGAAQGPGRQAGRQAGRQSARVWLVAAYKAPGAFVAASLATRERRRCAARPRDKAGRLPAERNKS
jgi:hypothetical protein